MAEPTSPAQTPNDQPTVVSAGAPDPIGTHGASFGFVLGDELGAGGMGIVYAATDTELGREVALKTLRPEYASASAAARFVDEARITARLQHPGIPPIYRTGELSDGRPFLAMKLIRGRTLAALLATNPSLEDRLGAFEQVCLAVGYAHEHGVIHRDLKPANVMVGAFGEVQVMDWGLAKVLGEAPVGFTDGAPDSAADETRQGEAMGTPQFMPPEQARGAWHEVDERADVFALGGVLAVLLTGVPPYTGPTSRAVLARAESGDLTECFARLDACGADAELIALAKRCLSAERDLRPASAGEVAEAVAAHRAGVRARLAAAETARAAAEVEAREQKRRRRVQLALAAAVLLIAAGGAAVAVRESVRAERERTEEARRETERLRLEGDKERAERERAAAVARARERVPELLAQATDQRRRYLFDQAARTLGSAAELANDLPDLAAEVAQARADLALVVELDTIRDKKWVRVFRDRQLDEGGVLDHFDTASAPLAYQRVLADRGYDPFGEPAAFAERVRASKVKGELVAALDDWAVYEKDAARAERLLAALRQIDPGAWLDRFRAPAVRASQTALLELAAERPADLAPSAIACLAELLTRQEADPSALLAAGTRQYPNDFPLAFARGLAPQRLSEQVRTWRPLRDAVTEAAEAAVLPFAPPVPNGEPPARAWQPEPRRPPGRVPPRPRPGLSITTIRTTGLEHVRPHELIESVGFMRVAHALRPDNVYALYNLGNILSALREDDESIAAFRAALARDPNLLAAQFNVTEVYRRQWMWDELADSARKVLAVDRASVGYMANCLAEAYDGLRDPDPWLRAAREAAEIQPKNANARNNYGTLLSLRGKRQEAETEFRTALELDRTNENALRNLASGLSGRKDYTSALPLLERWAAAHPNSDSFTELALCHIRLGNPARARAVLEEALAKKVDSATVHLLLGQIARNAREWDRAVEQYTLAAEKDPNEPLAFVNLGNLYAQKGDWARAEPAYARYTELRPTDADGWHRLGAARFYTERYSAAAGAFRRAGRAAREARDPPARRAMYEADLGEALWMIGDDLAARACFHTALELDETWADAHFYLGRLRHEHNELAEAAESYRLAAKYDKRQYGHLPAWLPLKGALAPMPRAKTPNP
jgi:tetratricopeptide (TPR) repeat protein